MQSDSGSASGVIRPQNQTRVKHKRKCTKKKKKATNASSNEENTARSRD